MKSLKVTECVLHFPDLQILPLIALLYSSIARLSLKPTSVVYLDYRLYA